MNYERNKGGGNKTVERGQVNRRWKRRRRGRGKNSVRDAKRANLQGTEEGKKGRKEKAKGRRAKEGRKRVEEGG